MSDAQGFKNFLSNAIQTGVDKVQQAAGQKSGNSTFYPTTIHSQRNLKCGWLKKQGGVVKSWKKRWFALKGDQLYYFLSEDESKPPQGVISLPGNDVVEMPMNSNKPEEFLFEIVPGGDKSKMTISHETYLICASDDTERKEWVQVIRKVMFSKIGGAIFGQKLDETLAYEQKRTGQRKIPEIVESCVDFLMNHGLDVEGIFRLPGRTSLIRELKERYDRGNRPKLNPEDHDVQTVASLLKQYLRELPEPLIPKSQYETTMYQVNREFHLNPDTAVEHLSSIMKEIAPAYYNLLQYLCKFLYEVAQHSDKNKMTEINLATVFVHSIIRPEDEDPTLLMATANSRTQAVFVLINKHKEIFRIEYTAHGSLVAVDNLLDIENVQCGEKPFNANEGSGKESSIGQGFADDVLGNLDLIANPTTDNNNLPLPLAPEMNPDDDPGNRRGSRRARVFTDYLDQNNANESDDDDTYTEIDTADFPLNKQTTENHTTSKDYTVAGNDHYCLETSTTSSKGDEEDYTTVKDIKDILRTKPVEEREHCDSIASIDDDYSSLADYTSLLREKSSQMYKENGDKAEGTDNNTSNSPEELYRKVVKNSPTRQSTETGNEESESKKENVPPIPPKRPPVPSPRRSIRPQTVFFDKFDPQTEKNKLLSKAQSVDVLYSNEEVGNVTDKPIIQNHRPNIPNNRPNILEHKPSIPDHRPNQRQTRFNSTESTASSQGGSVKSTNSEYQSIEALISVDLSGASKEELLSHIESLRNELLDKSEKISSMKKQHNKQMQDLAAKITQEKNATQVAVDKVMQLQRSIQRYQMKFGSLHE